MYDDDIIRINWRAVVIVLWALIFALTLVGTAYTYVNTPDVENFRGFAEPGGTKHEGKISYLFIPSLFMLIGVVYAISKMRRYKPEDDVDVAHFLLVTGLILLMGLMATISCTRALRQAALVKPQQQSPVLEEAKPAPDPSRLGQRLPRGRC